MAEAGHPFKVLTGLVEEFGTDRVIDTPISEPGYAGIGVGNESNLRLFHFEDGAWVDRTVSVDTANDVIYAAVTSFSPFALICPGGA